MRARRHRHHGNLGLWPCSIVKAVRGPSREGLSTGPRGCEGLEKSFIVTGGAASLLIMDRARASRRRSSSSRKPSPLSVIRDPKGRKEAVANG